MTCNIIFFDPDFSQMADLTLFCLVQGNAIAQTFPLSINRNENIGQLKKAIKTKKIPEFNFFDVDRLKIWKVQIRADDVASGFFNGRGGAGPKIEICEISGIF